MRVPYPNAPVHMSRSRHNLVLFYFAVADQSDDTQVCITLSGRRAELFTRNSHSGCKENPRLLFDL